MAAPVRAFHCARTFHFSTSLPFFGRSRSGFYSLPSPSSPTSPSFGFEFQRKYIFFPHPPSLGFNNPTPPTPPASPAKPLRLEAWVEIGEVGVER